MHSLLEKLLKKRNIDDSSKLSKEEAETFDRWNSILGQGGITVDKIQEFCKIQIDIIETQLDNIDNSLQKNERLVLLHSVYRNLFKVINSPATERDSLEKYLTNLLTEN